MNQTFLLRTRCALAAALLAACGCAWAGRPLTVDDANVNDAGTGYVELWAARAAGLTVFNLAPAYALVAGVELGALVTRERGGTITAGAVQVKWRITPSQENGCNVGAVVGLGHVNHGNTNEPHLDGLLSCNDGSYGSLHFNVGVVKPSGTRATTSWGVAVDRAFGPVTPHLEWVGAQGAKPSLHMGLRGDIFPNVQLDGSIGRSDLETLYTLGVKFSF